MCVCVCGKFKSGNNSTHIPMAQSTIWKLMFCFVFLWGFFFWYIISIFTFLAWNFVFTHRYLMLLFKATGWIFEVWSLVLLSWWLKEMGHRVTWDLLPRWIKPCLPGSATFEKEAFPHSEQAMLVWAWLEPDLLTQFKECALGAATNGCSGCDALVHNTPLPLHQCNEEQ